MLNFVDVVLHNSSTDIHHKEMIDEIEINKNAPVFGKTQ